MAEQFWCRYAQKIEIPGGVLVRYTVECTADTCPYETTELGKCRTQGPRGTACLKEGYLPVILAETDAEKLMTVK